MAEFDAIVFDPATTLGGKTLVQASAGTGKTYNIQNVYLRLVVSDGLPVESLLVVTFTEAATHELRERLRTILAKCRDHLEGRLATEDPDRTRVEAVLALPLKGDTAVGKTPDALSRVRLALMEFDNAAIFTIHAFCKRILDRYAFECGYDPDAELLEKENRIVADVCRDWWRAQMYRPAAAFPISLEGPGALAGLVQERLARPGAELRPKPVSSATAKAALSALETTVGGFLTARAATGRLAHLNPLADAKAAEAGMAELLAAVQARPMDPRVVREWVVEATQRLDKAKWKGTPGLAEDEKEALAEVLRAVHQVLAGDIGGIVETLAERVRAEVRERRAMTYDDMLENVRRALADATVAERLLVVLRAEFPAALIDEFQDTDPVQYEIFEQIFGKAKTLPLLFVGDPKQAIFGFRGGDVFTYYRAHREVAADRCHTLGTNYRSETRLVAAVNELFADHNDDRAFVNPNIRTAALKARDVPAGRRLTVDGKPDATPFRLWHYAVAQKRVPGADSPAAVRVYAEVADEIVRLLSDPKLTLGERRVRPSDIAILVTTHAEADSLQAALAARAVNSVRQSTGNVMDGEEARGMALILHAMLEPGNAGAVRSALATPLLPCLRADLLRFGPDALRAVPEDPTPSAPSGARPDSLEAWMGEFKDAGSLWRRRSFIAGFRHLVERLGLKAHLIGMEDGERRLTDVLHLADLAHQAARTNGLAPPSLLRWFIRQLDPGQRDPDAAQTSRRSSDDDAVRIMTVFVSKGLEFPIVFVPTLWRRNADRARPGERIALYHDGDAMVLDLDHANPEVRDRVRQEKLEEDLRLIYVAVTRAVNRTYLVSLSAGDPGAYALPRLINRWRAAGGPDTGSAVAFEECADEDETSAETPAVWTRGREPAPKASALQAEAERTGTPPRVDKAHGHTSFTSLAMHDRVAPGLELRDVDGSDAASGAPDPDDTGIFSIPGGAKTGECWHSILERLDFQGDPDHVRSVVEGELDRYHICNGPTDEVISRQREAVHEMIERVLTVPLAGDPGFRLRDIPRRARRSEMAFHFTLQQHRGQQPLGVLRQALDRHWQGPARSEAFLATLAGATPSLPLGFMTGFMDLVFCHRDRFYIVDWKSNKLGGRAGDFGPGGLAREMAVHSYYLQYLIYTVAVHGFLSQALAAYDYDRHFGGVFYVFLRGVDGSPGRGIFHDRPARELIEAMSAVLARGREGDA